ncbi:Fe-S cluster assembly protein SufB [Candidatus Dependentiae bacterium]|nr:Fe-S cluster assembly protein SufB [Candidatus Dependentiae bacterium]
MKLKNKNCNNCLNSCFKQHVYKSPKGLNEQIIKNISEEKNEPDWMLQLRLKAFEFFQFEKFPAWGPDLSKLDIQNLYYYIKKTNKKETSWNDVPHDIKNTFDQLGLQKIEKEYLGGLGAQYESETVYHNLKQEWQERGVIFCDTDTALQKHFDIFKKYFGTVVGYKDNKFAALNTAVWSGGSFIYVPKGVNVTIPLQAYYRIDSQNFGQFERTLIIADENSSVSYIEGCTAPKNSENDLHSAVVEIIAHKNAKVKYYTIQNWSKSVYNLVTKRALAHENSIIEWIDGNIGSGITMKYPGVILKGQGAKTEILSLAMAGQKNQIQDSGARVFHLAQNTSSKVVSKSISCNGGRSSFRAKVKVIKNAKQSKSFIQCDSLLLDDKSRADAYPYLEIQEKNINVGHEAKINKIEEEKLFYLQSRGIKPLDAQALIVNGFIDSFTKELPPEYAIEINRLIEAEMKGEKNEL